MSKHEKILLFRPDHLGDMLLTTPVIYALRKAKPDAHITLVAGSWTSTLLAGNPDFDDLITCNLPWLDRTGKPSWKPLLPIIRQIRSQKFDHIINFRVAAKAAAFARLLGAKQRWGFDVAKSRWAWSNKVQYDDNKHVVDNYMALAHALGVQDPTVQFRIFPESEDLSGVESFMRDSPPAVILGITSGRPDKSWLPDRWAAIGDHLVEKGFRVLINGAASEETEVQQVQSLMQNEAESLAGRFSILQFAGLLQKCAAIITLDSFPTHLAAAVGAPTIALFGANSSVQWGPYPGQYPRIIVEPPPEIPRDAQAMKWIQVTHVIDAIKHLEIKKQTH